MKLLHTSLRCCVSAFLFTGCGDDAAATVDVTAAELSDSSASDVGETAIPQETTESGDVAADSVLDTDGLSPCEKACVEQHPTGSSLLKAWLDCQEDACKAFDPTTEEGDACIFASFSPDNPDAACGDETQRCFSNTDAGCKELVDLAADRCEPAALPMSEEALGGVSLCIIEVGWNATPAVQALAWPLYLCVFSGPPNGCVEECLLGADACRACAADKCKVFYDPCIANSSGTPITPAVVPADAADCRAVFQCMNSCGP